MTKRLAMFLVVGIALAIFAQISQANSQTSLGMVTNKTGETCPARRDFLQTSSESCYTATLSACPGNADLQFTYGVAAPSGTPNGTIVFFAGDGGGTAADGPGEQAVLTQYLNDGWQVVQIAWGPDASPEDWEETNVTGAPSILTAACRPATFLNWVRNSNSGVGNGIWGKNGGMCAQGHSAGSGAIAYALTWYNAGVATATNGGGYLDYVSLDSGPVFSDIEQGCEVNSYGVNAQYTFICQKAGQTGCQGWTPIQDPPGSSLEYVSGYKGEVNVWSGNPSPSCANNSSQTSTTENQNWYQMSILYTPTTGQQPSFNYTNTTMSAYLCGSTAPGVLTDNAAAQGQLYYAEFTSQSQAGGALGVWEVTGCPSTEGVYESGATIAVNGDAASTDIYKNMESSCVSHH